MSAIVIGGGIAGVSAAAELSRDRHVTLIEAEDHLAHHASGRSAAMFIEDYGNATIRALSRASTGPLQDAGVLSPRGALMLARADQSEGFDAEHRSFGMTQLSVDEAAVLFPILNRNTVALAAYRADVFDLDTDLLLHGFRKRALANGAKFVTRARIDKIVRDGDGWQVTWPGGEARADLLVNAAGAWADGVAAMAGIAQVGLQPFRRSMARIAAPDGHDVTRWPLAEGLGEGWYAKPDAGKLIVSPSEEHPMDPHDAFSDDMVLAEGLDRYQEMVTPPVTRIEHSWAGLRTFAPDRALVIGSRDPGFFWLAGQGGYGFQTAPAAARLLGDLVAGRQSELPPEVVSALTPARFENLQNRNFPTPPISG